MTSGILNSYWLAWLHKMGFQIYWEGEMDIRKTMIVIISQVIDEWIDDEGLDPISLQDNMEFASRIYDRLVSEGMVSAEAGKAVIDILEERERQDEQWGVSDHTSQLWVTILMKQVGQFSEAALRDSRIEDLRKEAVQIAAVALAMIENIDRVKAEFRGSE